MKKRCLCFVANADNVHTQRWLRYFILQGHTVFCLSDKPAQIEGVTVWLLPTRDDLLKQNKRARKADVIQARAVQIQTYIQQCKPDVVHALYSYLRGWSAALAKVTCREGFPPLVITLLGNDIDLLPEYYRSPFHLMRDHWLNQLSLNVCDLVTGVSHQLCQAAKKMVSGLASTHTPIELITLGANLQLFYPDKNNPVLAEWRQRLNIPLDANIILSPRIMAPLYQIDRLIEAIPSVLARYPNTVFILKDTQADTPERQAYVETLHALAAQLGVSEAIRWINTVPIEQLPELYNLADVVVSIPSTDGMPVTLLEAMACETPVIVSDLAAYNGLIETATGIRVNFKEFATGISALGNALIETLQNPSAAYERARQGGMIARELGDFDAHMARMETLYYKALSMDETGAHKNSFSLQYGLNALLLKSLVKLS
ncbi:MAG: glycosyltransferase family 4 protein [Cyanobacteria bacterium]|nr:glycosyltransferase family 4 protein [Cyanobacteriota bacterium]